MADSYNTPLIGAPFDESIQKQLQARQNQLYQIGYRTDENLSYLGSKNCWVRLFSFVEITDTSIIKNATEGIITAGKDGISLAEEWVLASGLRHNGALRYGLGVESPYNTPLFATENVTTGAYGVGGTKELGYRPMPGIMSVDIVSQPPLGTLRTATIQLKAWNLNQISILDMLYFRLGFTMLLEWGHSTFVDNDGRFVNNPVPINILDRTLTKDSLSKELAKKRLDYNHNYDGMLGVVTNYSWQQAGDGSFDCTIRLTGLGSIIESLKINGLFALPDNQATATPTTGEGSENTPSTNQSLTSAVNSGVEIFLNNIKTLAAANADQPTFQKEVTKYFAKGLNLLNPPYSPEFQKGYSIKYGKLRPGQKYAVADIPDVDFTKLVTYLKVKQDVFEGGNSTSVDSVYIPLGLLLMYLVNSCLLYNKVQGKTQPTVYIDFNPSTNLCLRLDQQLSTDPTVCYISLNSTSTDSAFWAKLFEPSAVANLKDPQLSNFAAGSVNTAIVNQTKCEYVDTTDTTNTKGRIMNILVNVDFIASTIIGLKDDKQNVFLGEFLTTLMSGISSAIGGINEFVVGFDETTSTIIIYDAQYSNAADQQKPLPEIPVFGLKTTVRSYGLQTEASSKLGSMLAISARAGAHSLAGSNQDASSFVAINSKLKDRLLIDTSNDPTENTDTGSVTAPTTDFSIQNQFNAQVCNYYGVDSKPVSYDTSLIYGVQNYYINQLISIKGGSSPNEADSVTATGILPLALNITLEGIGGIPLYQGFTLPKDRLPAQYKDGGNGKQLVGFVVSGLNHTISNNEWLTTIISKMVNLPKGRRTVELSRSKSINTTPPPTRQTPRGSRVGQDPYDTSPVARYYKGKGYSNGEIPNDELVYLNTDDAESNRLHRLHPVAAAQWSALLTAARKDGFGKKDLNISYLKNAAYRSRADQKVAANAATPGQSPHGWGGVVDIQQLFTAQDKGSAKPGPAARVRATNKLYKWLESNGPLYGWYNPYRLADGQGQEESWHFEYWGSI